MGDSVQGGVQHLSTGRESVRVWEHAIVNI